MQNAACGSQYRFHSANCLCPVLQGSWTLGGQKETNS
ncbi:hypothetical protein DF3PA_140102 [Candidatus Defluviicoccus seviourii]|uniref:Uncharacterized protein n=1 Tax=Candidatus Defluviicoccus seviourii TaxID=2565273 RepID=A0A564WBS2_9PROT|nr:hypothetical protein DF3PA_140102 [Candidatus Defluviicoccus seviourii]